MTKSIDKSNVNRRQFLKQSGSLAAGAAVLGSLSPAAFAGEDNTIRLAGAAPAPSATPCLSRTAGRSSCMPRPISSRRRWKGRSRR